MPKLKPAPLTPREAGQAFLETLWFSFASRIVERAIKTYNVEEDAANALRAKFLKRGDYSVACASQNILVDDSQ
jgi:hypothetical protein